MVGSLFPGWANGLRLSRVKYASGDKKKSILRFRENALFLYFALSQGAG